MIVDYKKVPELCDEMLRKVELRGVSFDIYKDGKPFVRMVPVNTEDVRSVTDTL